MASAVNKIALQRQALQHHAAEKLGLHGLTIAPAEAADRKALGARKNVLQRLFPDLSEVRDGFVVTGTNPKGQQVRALLDVIDQKATQRTNLESAIVFGATAILALMKLPIAALSLGVVAAGTDLVPVLRKLVQGKNLEGQDKAAGRIGLEHLAATLLCSMTGGVVALGAKGLKLANAVTEGVQTGEVDRRTVWAALEGIVGIHSPGATSTDDLRVVAHSQEAVEPAA